MGKRESQYSTSPNRFHPLERNPGTQIKLRR